MDDVIKIMSELKIDSKSYSLSFEWSEEELDKDKSGTSEETHVLEDDSSELINDLTKENTNIYYSFIL